jgi:quinol monooxygenase YgiN
MKGKPTTAPSCFIEENRDSIEHTWSNPMGPVSTLRQEAGFVTFGILRTAHRETAAMLVNGMTSEAHENQRHVAGFVSSRVHVSLDGTTVVSRGRWASEADYRSYARAGSGGELCGFSNRPGVLAVTLFRGIPAPGIEGPAAAEKPGIVAVATRHIGGPESAHAVVDLLRRTGEWKRYFLGFISATPYISQDGRTYVNYPQWVSEAAYHAYMADPRIVDGQAEIARYEVAPPEFVLCRPVENIVATPFRKPEHPKRGTHR